MTYDIEITEAADRDIKGIYQYIAYTLLVPDIALHQLEKIEECIMSLEEMPYRFAIYERETWKSKGMRKVYINNFIVFYIPLEDTEKVVIIRVMYNGMDIDTEFNKMII